MTSAQTDIGDRLSFGTAQDVGKRSNQEDRFAVQEFQTSDGHRGILALVADGIGGHNRGEVASELAKTAIPQHLASKAPVASQVALTLKAALEEASHDIYEASLEDESRSGMGTTCTAVIVMDGRLYLAHAGDSRAYLLRGKELRQLSIDHTWAEDAIRAGRPAEEIRNHPNRGVIKRYLGIDPQVEVDTRFRLNGGESLGDATAEPLSLEPGDMIMLCSDGVADVLENTQIVTFMQSGEPAQAARNIVAGALKSGASDNVTAVVLRVPGGRSVGGGKKMPLWVFGVVLLVVALAVAVLAMVVMKPSRSAPAVPSTMVGGGNNKTPVVAAGVPQRTPGAGGLVMVTLPPGSEAGADPGPTNIAGSTAGSGSEPTLVPTRTSVPTQLPPTQEPTSTTAPTPTESRASPQAVTGGGVELLAPDDSANLSSKVEFRWRNGSGFALQMGERYELAFWKSGQVPLRDALSPVAATTIASVVVDLPLVDVGGGVLGALVEPGRLEWGVFLLDATDQRVRLLSEERSFVYQRPSDHSGSSGPVR